MSSTRRRSSSSSIDWPAWIRTFGVAILTLVGTLTAFYFTTKLTLDKHEQQFAEINKTFEKFNNTLLKNYDDYAKNQKEEQSIREKMRDQFTQLFTQLTTNSVTTGTKVESITKQLDAVTSKIDQIQNVQQQNRQYIQSLPTGRR